MADSTYDIESIVKQVLAEIKAGEAVRHTVKPTVGQLAISTPLVSLEQVQGRLQGVGRLLVPRGAVVTPSVRDLLRENNVALTFSTGTDEKVKGGRGGGVSLSLTATLVKPALRFDLAALGRGLKHDGIDVEESTSDCLIETTDRFAALVKNDGPALGAIVTSHPAPGLCLANRLHGVRAIGPATVAEVTRDAEGVGANLIIIAPAGRGIFQIRQMIRTFCSSGPRQCPAALAGRLT